MSSVVKFRTINGMLDALLEKYSESPRPILMWKTEKKYRGISYREFGQWVERIAFGLASIGVRSGDRVALLSENRPEWVVADMAMVRLGAINVSIYPSLTPRQIAYILNDSGASCVVLSNRLQLKKILGIRADLPLLRHIVIFADPGPDANDVVGFDDLAGMGKDHQMKNPGHVARESSAVTPGSLLTLIYTSGTTGDPKGVMLTHGNLVSNILSSTECIPFVEDDILLSFLPLCHSYERMAGYYSAMSCGVTIAYAESVDTVRENLMEVRPTIVTTVPRLFERIHAGLAKQEKAMPPLKRAVYRWAMSVRASHARRRGGAAPRSTRGIRYAIADWLVFSKIRARMGGRIRFFVSGGAALPVELGEFFDGIGINILEGYGMTESSPVISVNRPQKRKYGTVGMPIPGVEVSIASDGEILARGPNVMRGYWNDETGTAEMIDAGGWLHTGDIGKFDDDGFLVITDRKKHLIVNSGGKNIAPGPLESAFLRSGLISQILVIGDGRGFLTALIVPEFDQLAERLSAGGMRVPPPEELVSLETVRGLYREELDRLQKDFASFERVRRFSLMPGPFTQEKGEITPTLKIRRSEVEKKYRSLIEKMYEGTP
ncbi:MAG TPA: long-chain fatty acid--CoA ligase [Bacteroidota bacterium]|nr:long-chain fatty acid--CoA ligase [Bacteroidota bacterium]